MKQQVLVYFANETCISLSRLRRIEARIEWLRRYGDPAAIATAERVAEDLDRFPTSTHRQVLQLLEVLRRADEAAAPVAALVFTNETASRGWYVLHAGGTSRKVPLPGVDASHPTLEDVPLCSPAGLRGTLRETAARFAPDEHEYLLITRSHGTQDMAITHAMFEAALDRPPAATPQPVTPSNLGWAELGVRGLGFRGLGERGMGEKGMILGDRVLASAGVGVTKREYLDVLEEAGDALGMVFKLVFMDSCGSEIPEDLAREIPRNIHALYGSTPDGLNYDAPDFSLIGTQIDLCTHSGGVLHALEKLLALTPNVRRFPLEVGECRLCSL